MIRNGVGVFVGWDLAQNKFNFFLQAKVQLGIEIKRKAVEIKRKAYRGETRVSPVILISSDSLLSPYWFPIDFLLIPSRVQ